MMMKMVNNWSMYDNDKGRYVWGPEHIKRNKLWHQLMEEKESELLQWGEKNGICNKNDYEIEEDDDEPTKQSKEKNKLFALSDIVSRTLTTKALRQVYTSSVTQTNLLCHYDCEIGNEKVESKFKLNDDDQFPTDDISMPKADYLRCLEEDAIISIPYWNGVVVGYRMSSGVPSSKDWNKPTSTVLGGNDGGKRKEEGRISFKRENAIWTTTITMPTEWNDDNTTTI